ncbi:MULTISPECIES: FecCD family ABC transporter permease [Rhodobacterales]|jgi:iron complex transport system permease protein|uniref:FecCD family ABC transporter permease n=1 Tax=Rhodobacterales TaxID=204455 RepID=UPI00237F18EC|nr:iron ABC transporter permease [Phaeobacter gallaeciensis]MDE4098825.1 iron ABC transporter permease [Phaeobacter gallaeciensis]MDE4107757.1 iron ABC transporter permease [Phaeobacter gallaeciensis]MDE4112211.1 iron ABC transporter permease [Phaeobacter gallaeciensis]MDE4116683.1 iron ABC transporter permease [Phaeobacter gallaeciensis]MDE4121031.1 iron ABC transporter permease [Phaeobacter gallaeciensis]
MTRLMLCLSAAVLALFLISLTVGPADVGVGESLAALFDDGYGPLSLVMREIRLPRAILAAVIGAGLGLAGAAMQGYLRNPLAEPGLIGVSSSAALGAVLAINTGLAATATLGLPLSALAGALGGVFLVMALAGQHGGSLTLILAGIAISAMAGALTSLVLNLSPNPFAANEIVFWMMGSLSDRSMQHVWLALPFVLAGMVILLPLGRGLDALTLGEDAAQTMGVNLRQLRWFLVVGTASIAGGTTAVAGAIGFVGLVVPHILRPFVDGQPSRLLWASTLGGAIMLQLADIAVRLILPTRDLKLGVVTALVGAPLFLHLIYKTRKGLA